MAATYFDASALVKIVLTERDNARADRIWNTAQARHASPLAYVEACSAVAAAHRNHQIDDDDQLRALTDVEEVRCRLMRVHLTDQVASHATVLARAHGLKGADAIHLASALALRDPGLVFATWDRRLRAAATAEGLRVAPASLAS